MLDNPVEREIRAAGADDSVVFVFPSDVAATLWREAALDITGRNALPAGRFAAWDRFKERAVQSTVAGREPVSAMIRRLYAIDLARRNRESPTRIFSSLIPAPFADSGSVFAPWIAKLLPSLALLERKRLVAGARARESGVMGDDEDRDLAALKADYARFLDAAGLFEPSWQMPPLRDSGERFVIFFPEAIEDYSEYAELLASAPFVRTVSAFARTAGDSATAKQNESVARSAGVAAQPRGPAASSHAQLDLWADASEATPEQIETRESSDLNEPRQNPALTVHPTTRDEFKAVALEIESILRAGVPPESIAISAPELEKVAPYLLRELSLRSIPYEYRAGSPLGACPAGRFFSLAAACVASGFAFARFKALLLDRSIPWKRRELAEELVRFGIRNHCVTGWNDDGKRVDAWEAAFRDPASAERGDWRLRDWYLALSRALSALTAARGFAEIRVRWFAFRNDFLDASLLSDKDDAVLARCVEELGALASLEGRFPDLMPEEPFALFVSALAERQYVRRRAGSGVNVFPYRVAAGAPFPWHFVVDASQDGATVVYRPLSYLRDDKRAALALDDVDASEAFFALYRRGPLLPDGHSYTRVVTGATPIDAGPMPPRPAPGARFSCAVRGFSGYRVPHSAFTERSVPVPPSLPDPFAAEAAWLLGRGGEPDRLYPAQKRSFEAAAARGGSRGFSYLAEAYGGRVDALTERIRERLGRKDGTLATATILNAWAACGAKLLIGTILGVERETADAELMDERNLGILYHDVLCKVFGRIRDEDGSFRRERLGTYRAWAEEMARDSTRGYSEFQGPLAAPLIDTLADRLIDGACAILDADAALLDGFAPRVLEGELSYADGGLSYYGRVDRISVDDAGEAVLIDYKSGYITPTAKYEVSADGAVGDCQMPLYALLAERAEGSPTKGSPLRFAWFGDIKKGKYQPVIHDRETIPWHARTKLFSRAEFEPAMEAFGRMASRYARGVAEEDFTRPASLPWTECASCEFRKICRHVYAVRP